MAAEEAEEEVRLEVEAVAAVYGDDCRVVSEFPPHLIVHVRPRTADDSSQQFVELFLGIKASLQYPKEPPHIYAAESKGLDENRQAYLLSSIKNKAVELSCYPMLVTLCECPNPNVLSFMASVLFTSFRTHYSHEKDELSLGLLSRAADAQCHLEEAGDILSNMNHPSGDCPLCLYPLVPDDKDGSVMPFMKLMSCYHCFHSDCIMRWWEWLQHDDINSKEGSTTVTTGDRLYNINHYKGFCPVCRKLFNEKDIEHVRDLLGTNTSQLASLTIDLNENKEELLNSKLENNRREKFVALFNLQQERNGLIEPKKELAIQPGMYVTLPRSETATGAAEDSAGPCEGTTTSTTEVEPRSQANNTSTNKHHSSSTRRRNRAYAPRRQQHGHPARQQWQRRDADNSHQ